MDAKGQGTIRSGGGILKAAKSRIYSSPIGPQAPGFFDKLRAVPYLGRAVPFLTGATGTFGSAALTGMGIGKVADFVTRATDSPEAYQFRKDAIRANPFLFDETSTDEFIEFSEELDEKQKEGEAPGLYPGGYEKFLKDKGYVKDEDGRVVKEEEIVIEKVEDEPNRHSCSRNKR